jgi:hypothetical protein
MIVMNSADGRGKRVLTIRNSKYDRDVLGGAGFLEIQWAPAHWIVFSQNTWLGSVDPARGLRFASPGARTPSSSPTTDAKLRS